MSACTSQGQNDFSEQKNVQCLDGEIWFVSFSVMFQNFTTVSETAAKKVLGENSLQQTLMIFLTFLWTWTWS